MVKRPFTDSVLVKGPSQGGPFAFPLSWAARALNGSPYLNQAKSLRFAGCSMQ